MRARCWLCVLFFLSLSACTLTQTKEAPVALETHALLQDQQAMLSAHALQLDTLSQAQTSLIGHLEQLQGQLTLLSEQVANQTKKLDRPAAKPSAPPVREIVQQPRKAVLELSGKAVIGRVEYVWLESAGKYFKARIDTGAKSSSLDASNIQPFERNGDRWVRFDVTFPDETVKTLEAPLLRNVRIRQAAVEELERRPVVKMRVRLGELDEETEFSLSDRGKMLYPVLLGRSFLQDIAVVDVARKFTRKRNLKSKPTIQVEPK